MSLFSKFQYINTGEIFFSKIDGSGVYRDTGLTVPDPMDYYGVEQECKVFEEINTGETLICKAITIKGEPEIDKHIYNTKNSTSRDLLYWPRDVAEFTCSSSETTNCVEAFYAPQKEYKGITDITRAVLFSPLDYVKNRPLTEHLKSIGKINYTNEEIRKLAADILKAIQELNDAGFLYLDISFDKIRMTEEGKIYLDYSALLFNTSDVANRIYYNYYPVEFGQPAVIRGDITIPDKEAQDYSLTAMMFHLFYGRDAYDGGLMDDYRREGDEQSHYEKYKIYHELPYFIFDENNQANRIGDFGDERKIVDLWKSTPQTIKGGFIRALATENALRKSDAEGSPTPEEWIKLLKEENWI